MLFLLLRRWINDAHPTSENGRLAAFASGRPAFQQHAKHAEGNDTTPRLAHTENHERRTYKSRFRQKRKRSRSPAGPRRLGTATRISASLFRRLSASFWRTPGQDPKTAKCAVLIPGHAGFPNCVKRSEGSDSAPIRNTPCFGVWAVVCDFSPKAEGVPAFACESERGHLWEKLKIGMRNGWWIKFMRQLCRIFSLCRW